MTVEAKTKLATIFVAEDSSSSKSYKINFPPVTTTPTRCGKQLFYKITTPEEGYPDILTYKYTSKRLYAGTGDDAQDSVSVEFTKGESAKPKSMYEYYITPVDGEGNEYVAAGEKYT